MLCVLLSLKVAFVLAYKIFLLSWCIIPLIIVLHVLYFFEIVPLVFLIGVLFDNHLVDEVGCGNQYIQGWVGSILLLYSQYANRLSFVIKAAILLIVLIGIKARLVASWHLFEGCLLFFSKLAPLFSYSLLYLGCRKVGVTLLKHR